MAPGATLLLSTPVYNGRQMAANHIREVTIDEMRSELEAAGFEVVKRYGTFASKHDVVRGLREQYPDVAEQLIAIYEGTRELYDDNLLAAFLAPILPDYSRNNVWVCRKPGGGDEGGDLVPEQPEDDSDLRYEEDDSDPVPGDAGQE